MATWAIGDVQGCLDCLDRLLEKIRFDSTRDVLWFVGDLVNRGPDSAGVLRRVIGLQDRAIAILGNHDLHLLAIAAGLQPDPPDYRLGELLRADDRDALIDSVRQRPLIHHDPELNTVMVHAGLFPGWSLSQACALALEVQNVLNSNRWMSFVQNMYGDEPCRWNESLKDWERLRFITNAFTRMRFCRSDGSLDFSQKGPIVNSPSHLHPWFEVPAITDAPYRIVFGHWSDLGVHRHHNVICIDSGCVWGGQLAALQLEAQTRNLEMVDCPRV